MNSVQRKTRRKLIFSTLHVLLILVFTLNWTSLGEPLTRPLGKSPVTGSILTFVMLIPIAVGMELVFILFRETAESDE